MVQEIQTETSSLRPLKIICRETLTWLYVPWIRLLESGCTYWTRWGAGLFLTYSPIGLATTPASRPWAESKLHHNKQGFPGSGLMDPDPIWNPPLYRNYCQKKSSTYWYTSWESQSNAHNVCWIWQFFSVLRIRIRIRTTFLGLLDPDPLVIGMNPDLSVIKQNTSLKNDVNVRTYKK
jgi:hypothetical protein